VERVQKDADALPETAHAKGRDEQRRAVEKNAKTNAQKK